MSYVSTPSHPPPLQKLDSAWPTLDALNPPPSTVAPAAATTGGKKQPSPAQFYKHRDHSLTGSASRLDRIRAHQERGGGGLMESFAEEEEEEEEEEGEGNSEPGACHILVVYPHISLRVLYATIEVQKCS